MMSEHSQRFAADRLEEYRRECRRVSGDKVRIVPGMEYSTPKNHVHITCWGIDPYLGEELAIDDLLDAVDEAGGLAIFAHPGRRDAWREFRPRWAQSLFGVEVWNRKTDGLAPNKSAYDFVRDHNLEPIFALDFHNLRQKFPIFHKMMSHTQLLDVTEADFLLELRTAAPTACFMNVEMRRQDSLKGKLIGRSLQLANQASKPARRLLRRFVC